MLCTGFSLVVVSRGYFLLWCVGFSLQWLLLLRSTGSRHVGPSSCGTRAQQLWCTGLVASGHMGSYRTRDQTHVPCIGRRILNHCTTREVPVHCRILIHYLELNEVGWSSNKDRAMRYHFTLVRMAIIKKSTNNKCWRWCGEKGTLLHCRW